jgi:hemolysin III
MSGKGVTAKENKSMKEKKQKPALRGVLHHVAAFPAALGGFYLAWVAPTPAARWGCIVYALSLTTMFSVSATYHRLNWEPNHRTLMRRLDHAAIYGLIAGTYTPLCLVALDRSTCLRLLSQVWVGAFAGMAHTLLQSGGGFASKAFSAVLYVALGWIALPYTGMLKTVLGAMGSALVVGGGVIYSLGAVTYALKFPDPWPTVFGYHEMFHTMVTVASMLHFFAVRLAVLNVPA